MTKQTVQWIVGPKVEDPLEMLTFDELVHGIEQDESETETEEVERGE